MGYDTVPLDINGRRKVGALTPGTTTAVVSVTATSANVAVPAAQIVRVSSTTNCYVKFGTADTVAATNADILLIAGSELWQMPAGSTHVAFLRVSADGVAKLTAMD